MESDNVEDAEVEDNAAPEWVIATILAASPTPSQLLCLLDSPSSHGCRGILSKYLCNQIPVTALLTYVRTIATNIRGFGDLSELASGVETRLAARNTKIATFGKSRRISKEHPKVFESL
jgi:hypothetical protein